jgi:hypothetical protein
MENITDLIDKCIGTDGAHTDIAKVVYEMYKNKFKYSKEAGSKKYEWYELENDTWNEVPKGFKLYNILSEEVYQKFSERAIC